MKIRRRRSARDEADRKRWLAQAERWDGVAVVFNPWERKYELAEFYRDQISGPMMAWFDRLPARERQRIANSRDGE